MSKPGTAGGLTTNATGTAELRIMIPDRGSVTKCCDQLVMSVRNRGWGNVGLWAFYFLFLYENEIKAALMIKLHVESNWSRADV